MKSDPSLRCKSTDACVAKVKEGSTAFSSVSRLYYRPINNLLHNTEYPEHEHHQWSYV